MNQGWGGDPTCEVGFKTNGTFIMSQYGAPTFDITLSVIENDDGTYNTPQMNGNSPNIFRSYRSFPGQPDDAVSFNLFQLFPLESFKAMKEEECSDFNLVIKEAENLKCMSLSKR